MTQPYTPPPVPYQPYPMMAADPGRPFRRASLLMFILAGLMLLMAGCTALVSRVPLEQFPPEQQAELRKMLEPTGIDMGTYLLTVAAIIGVPALLMIGMGIGVRYGKRGWVLASLILTGLMLSMLGLSMLGTFVSGNMTAALGNAIVLAVPVGLLTMLFVWLLGCYRTASQPVAPAGYFQQAQPYPHYPAPQQGGYGYGYPPPQAPAPPTQQPPTPPGV